jgi:hypothetical protein
MKGGREHRVPLSKRAEEILSAMSRLRGSGFVFSGSKHNSLLSVMDLEMVMRRAGTDATVHGFRSSFRDWAGERTAFARDVAEAALAHLVGDETERAYRRGDALEKRRELMDAWTSFCAGEIDSKVVPFQATKAAARKRSAARVCAQLARSERCSDHTPFIRSSRSARWP